MKGFSEPIVNSEPLKDFKQKNHMMKIIFLTNIYGNIEKNGKEEVETGSKENSNFG